PFTKMMLPDSVDHHAREKRVGPAEYALGELEAAGTFGGQRLIRAGDGFEKSPVYLIARRFVIAADKDTLIDAGAIGGGDHTHGGGNLRFDFPQRRREHRIGFK